MENKNLINEEVRRYKLLTIYNNSKTLSENKKTLNEQPEEIVNVLKNAGESEIRGLKRFILTIPDQDFQNELSNIYKSHPEKDLYEIIPLLSKDSLKRVRYTLLNSPTVSNWVKDTISSGVAKVASNKYVGRDLNSIVNELKGRGYSDDAANRIANKIENINHSSGTAGNTAGNTGSRNFMDVARESELKDKIKSVFPEIGDKDLKTLVSNVKSKFPTNFSEFEQYIKEATQDYLPEYQEYMKKPGNRQILWQWFQRQGPKTKWGIFFLGLGTTYPILKSLGIDLGGIFSYITSGGKQALYDVTVGVKKGLKTPIDKSGDTNQSSNSSQVTMDQFNQFLTSHNVNPSRYKITQNGNVFTLNDKNNSSFIYDNGTFKRQ